MPPAATFSPHFGAYQAAMNEAQISPAHAGIPSRRAPQGVSANDSDALHSLVLKSLDDDLTARQKAVAEAEKPLPEDPKLVELRDRVTELSKPLPIDPQLARLERSVQLSGEQLQNTRLTTAQDLTWALINSPAFLFNR